MGKKEVIVQGCADSFPWAPNPIESIARCHLRWQVRDVFVVSSHFSGVAPPRKHGTCALATSACNYAELMSNADFVLSARIA